MPGSADRPVDRPRLPSGQTSTIRDILPTDIAHHLRVSTRCRQAFATSQFCSECEPYEAVARQNGTPKLTNTHSGLPFGAGQDTIDGVRCSPINKEDGGVKVSLAEDGAQRLRGTMAPQCEPQAKGLLSPLLCSVRPSRAAFVDVLLLSAGFQTRLLLLLVLRLRGL